MYTIKIMNEYLHGPIWTYGEDDIPMRDISLIANDPVLHELNLKAEKMYASYFEFDSHNQACWFNAEKQKEEKDFMISLLKKITKRLNDINDGSFVIEDIETPKIEAL